MLPVNYYSYNGDSMKKLLTNFITSSVFIVSLGCSVTNSNSRPETVTNSAAAPTDGFSEFLAHHDDVNLPQWKKDFEGCYAVEKIEEVATFDESYYMAGFEPTNDVAKICFNISTFAPGLYGDVLIYGKYFKSDGSEVRPGMGGPVLKAGLCENCLYSAHSWGMGSRVLRQYEQYTTLEFGSIRSGAGFDVKHPTLVTRVTLKKM